MSLVIRLTFSPEYQKNAQLHLPIQQFKPINIDMPPKAFDLRGHPLKSCGDGVFPPRDTLWRNLGQKFDDISTSPICGNTPRIFCHQDNGYIPKNANPKVLHILSGGRVLQHIWLYGHDTKCDVLLPDFCTEEFHLLALLVLGWVNQSELGCTRCGWRDTLAFHKSVFMIATLGAILPGSGDRLACLNYSFHNIPLKLDKYISKEERPFTYPFR